MKIGLGTAQFSGNYGITGKNNDFSQVEVNKIINLARKINIKYILYIFFKYF